MKKVTLAVYILVCIIVLGSIIFFFKGEFTGNAVRENASQIINNSIEITKDITVSNSLISNLIIVKSLRQRGRVLNISYEFNNTDFIGNDMSVDIWILNENKTEIRRIQDAFSINKEGFVWRDVSIDLYGEPAGVYNIYFALSKDLENSINQAFFLDESLETGNPVLNNPKTRMIGYLIFVAIILIGLFFIISGRIKKGKKEKEA